MSIVVVMSSSTCLAAGMFRNSIAVFAPLFVRNAPRRAFRSPSDRQELPVMEHREEHALNEVDRIAVAVNYLRLLLVAATAAEIRAQTQKAARTDRLRNQPPLP
jgi:hypothetical protein